MEVYALVGRKTENAGLVTRREQPEEETKKSDKNIGIG